MLAFGATNISTSGTEHLHVGAAVAAAANAAQECIVPRDGIYLNRMTAVHNTVGVGAGSITYRLFVNGIDSGLNVSLGVASFSATSENSTIVLQAGDRVGLRAEMTGVISAAPQGILVCVG